MNRPLRILMVLHMPWDRNLGGPRVQLELAEEFQALGYEVEKFDYNDAFPQTSSSRWAELTRPSFSSQAKKFVQANAHRFDIIDAHQGNLPFSKKELGFQGLLVARSVGLYALYEEFAQKEATKYPPKKIKTFIGNWLWSRKKNQEHPHYLHSFQTCDLINLPNHDELIYVREVMRLGKKCAVFPFGISKQRQKAFFQAIQPAKVRLANQQIAFIGAWGTRKGSKDWAKIIKLTRYKVPDVRFLFLGTGLSTKTVLAELELPNYDGIEIIPEYKSEELPELLADATVGAFPSYIEGFGFAVLEKLACGLPTVAYDVPGPREMLKHFDNSFMLPVGDIEKFSNQLVNLLQLDEGKYSQLSQRCVDVASKFCWETIAQETLDTYIKYYKKIKY